MCLSKFWRKKKTKERSIHGCTILVLSQERIMTWILNSKWKRHLEGKDLEEFAREFSTHLLEESVRVLPVDKGGIVKMTEGSFYPRNLSTPPNTIFEGKR